MWACKRPYRAWCRETVVVHSSKGFGTPKQKLSKPSSKGTAKTPEQAADQALAAAAKNAPNVRPINPKEAARGKVDYVQVKDWAGGEAADLGELAVVPDSYSTTFAPSRGEGQAAGPFYQQLARHAQYLESQGVLTIALEPGAKPFLPFESWQYSLPRYRQYLAEVAAVHAALEEALQLALSAPGQQAAAAAATSSNNGSSSSSNNGSSSSGRLPADVAAYSALACFSAECGLWRAQAAQADLEALALMAVAQQQQQLVNHPARAALEVHASQNAVSYGKYLLQLGRSAAAATAAAAAAAAASSQAQRDSSSASSGISSLVAEEDEGSTAALKLLAHAYALHVQQQCLGTRIGAAATEQLGLMAAGVAATAVYMDYPGHVKEPVQELKAVTNAAGRLLDDAGRQVVLDELPKALKKATLVLAPLATA